jgi:hypothetical protein
MEIKKAGRQEYGFRRCSCITSKDTRTATQAWSGVHPQARQFKIVSVRVHHPGWSEEKVMDEASLGAQWHEAGRALRSLAAVYDRR